MRRFRPIAAIALLVLIAWLMLFALTDFKDPTGDDTEQGAWTCTGTGSCSCTGAGTRYCQVTDYPDSSGSSYVTCTGITGNCGSANQACLTFTKGSFSIPAGSTSISVDVLYYDSKAGSPAAISAARLKVGGSYFNATTHNPTNATWVSRDDAWATNPKSTTAWTVTDINGGGSNDLQAFGFFTSDSTPNVSWSSARVQVTYTVPGGRRAQTIVGAWGPQ